jgi:transcriptional regulator with XRE-family HTH domain
MLQAAQETGRVTKLRIRILERNLKQYEVAAKAGIHPTRISEYCTGHKPIPARDLPLLAEALNCDPNDIIGFHEL